MKLKSAFTYNACIILSLSGAAYLWKMPTLLACAFVFLMILPKCSMKE